MHLIVGLGNPGAKYEKNRHNIGFMAVDEIMHRHNFPRAKEKFQGLLSEGEINSPGCEPARCMILKPQTFMNESGRSVGEAMRFYKLEPSQVIVIYDELDLERGKIRVKTGGGYAGHNGLKSLGAHIGADFQRLRVGIGHPGDKRMVSSYVLRDFTKTETKWVECLVETIGIYAGYLLWDKPSELLNKIALETRTALDELIKVEEKDNER